MDGMKLGHLWHEATPVPWEPSPWPPPTECCVPSITPGWTPSPDSTVGGRPTSENRTFCTSCSVCISASRDETTLLLTHRQLHTPSFPLLLLVWQAFHTRHYLSFPLWMHQMVQLLLHTGDTSHQMETHSYSTEGVWLSLPEIWADAVSRLY